MMKMRYHGAQPYDPGYGLADVGTLWYCESANSLTWELQEPRIVALSTLSRLVNAKLL